MLAPVELDHAFFLETSCPCAVALGDGSYGNDRDVRNSRFISALRGDVFARFAESSRALSTSSGARSARFVLIASRSRAAVAVELFVHIGSKLDHLSFDQFVVLEVGLDGELGSFSALPAS